MERPPSARESVAAILFAETSTIGLRYHCVARLKLAREMKEVETRWGRVRVKVSRAGNIVTARSNWLRAIGYYQTAASLLDAADQAHQVAIESMRGCAASFLNHRDPPGEVVSITWPSAYPLQGYLLPPRARAGRVPTVICIGEPGQRKEEYLYKMARHAEERGMALLAVDLLGAGAGNAFEDVVGRSDLESDQSRDGLSHPAGRCR